MDLGTAKESIGKDNIVAARLTQFGLWKRVRETPSLDPCTDRSKGFDAEVYVPAFLFAFTSGGVAIADGERLDEDESLKRLLGVEKIPNQSALGEWLRAIGDDRSGCAAPDQAGVCDL